MTNEREPAVPAFAQAEINRLAGLYNQGRLTEVAAAGAGLARRWPDVVMVQNILGAAYAGLGQFADAEACFRKAAALRPDFSEAHNNLGNVLQEQGKSAQAAASYRRALALKPDNADALYNLANTLRDRGELKDAVGCYTQALRLRPGDAEIYRDLGLAWQAAGRFADAIAAYRRATELAPSYSDAFYCLGNALQDEGLLDEALEAYTRAVAINPSEALAMAAKLHVQGRIGDWRWVREFSAQAQTLGIQGAAVPPFPLLTMDEDPARQALRAKAWAKAQFRQPKTGAFAPPARKPAKLRVGYFSADFHDHAIMFLTTGLFRNHDRSCFEIFIYSYGRQTEGERRRALPRQVDGFFDVQDLADDELVAKARGDRLDIAVDLMGYTLHSRTSIFAHGIAPIQIAWLGYPGTMGAPFIDYTIADPVVVPEAHRELYLEKLIYLPHSYQSNDNARVISDTVPSRQALGLPESGFVFCCFNNNHKIGPAEFDIWMRLLGQVEGSVLWLLKVNRWARDNLRREAQARGIDPDRLVFAGMASQEDHLARQRQADLFLDTFTYNAHTTASDALWAGLPVVTKAGKSFPARVAASLLYAVGLPELVTQTDEDYEQLALALARDNARLAAVRQKLAENRLTTPLFDSEAFARYIEAGYQAAYDLYFKGLAPETIVVDPAGALATPNEPPQAEESSPP